MLQKILNIKKLFQSNKSKVRIPMNTLYGSKCKFYVANLALICIVIMLSIVSVLTYFFLPVVDVSKLSEKAYIREVEETLPVDVESFDVEGKKIDAYAVIAKKNVFSPQREEWVVKAVIPNPSELAKKKKLAEKKPPAIKPKKIVLHGIIMAGDMKKALISNPLTGVSNKKTLYVEEGEELEGYKVISIESDQIRLDWQGEEIIVTLYSGVGGNEQVENTSNNYDEGMPGYGRRGKRRSSQYTEKSVGKDRFANEMVGSDNRMTSSFVPMSMVPAGRPETGTSFPFFKGLSADKHTGINKQSEEVEIPQLFDLPAEAELKQKALTEKPIEIVLHGIVIAGDIKKALVKIPIHDVSNNRTLYVEEGDGLEGYMVTSIEPDRLRLDWQGEEMVVKFPPL